MTTGWPAFQFSLFSNINEVIELPTENLNETEWSLVRPFAITPMSHGDVYSLEIDRREQSRLVSLVVVKSDMREGLIKTGARGASLGSLANKHA